MSASRRHDVAILTDFRYPGGTAASAAEEIRAQAGAGLSTVLVQAPSPYISPGSPFNGRIVSCLLRGEAELAVPGDCVSARVLVIRQPRIFTHGVPPLPPIEADEVVMVLNQSPRDPAKGIVYYVPDEIRECVEGRFGPRVRWVCVSPAVRREVLATSPRFPLAGDWPPIIDASGWQADRSAPVDAVPVIGRHSRPDPMKWPSTAEEILAAYPPTPDVRVRVLGGAEHALRRLGHKPSSWEVLPFGSVPVPAFLRSIDFFVYFHDSRRVEAFGRTIIEAMASGAPAILPSTFEPTFGDAALYSTPAEVRDLVDALYKDWDRYLEISAHGLAYVEQRFGPASHIARLQDLGIGDARTSPRDGRATAAIPSQSRHRNGQPAGKWPPLRPASALAVKRGLARMGTVAQLLIRDPRSGLPQIRQGLARRVRAWRSRRTPPTRAYLAFGIGPDEFAALSKHVAQAAQVAGTHVPLIVTDCAHPPVTCGVAVEYVPDRATWRERSRNPQGRWRRLPLQRTPASTMVVAPGAVPDLADILATEESPTASDDTRTSSGVALSRGWISPRYGDQGQIRDK